MVALQEASNKVLGDPKSYLTNEWQAKTVEKPTANYVLSLEAEQRLVDDFAFLAAAEEGGKAVSAVAVEQQRVPPRLTLRLAANQNVPREVPTRFKTMFNVLNECACRRRCYSAQPQATAGLTLRLGIQRRVCADLLFEQVILLSRNRIHGRLQSSLWKPPPHRRGVPRKPLHVGVQRISHTISKSRSQLNTQLDSKELMQKLDKLLVSFKRVDGCTKGTDEDLSMLKDIVRESHALVTSDGRLTMEETVASYGLPADEICKNSHIRQVDKIARYWGLCLFVAEAARKHQGIFQDMQLEILPPYSSVMSSISFDGSPVDCYVHAEIQLLTFYGLISNEEVPEPRVIGVSKAACYLCNLFIQSHGGYFISKTHGQLFEQWNVPDLAEFSECQRSRYRNSLAAMDREMRVALVSERKRPQGQGRNYPLHSWLNLPKAFPLSPLGSDTGTIHPRGDGDVHSQVADHDSEAIQPLASRTTDLRSSILRPHSRIISRQASPLHEDSAASLNRDQGSQDVSRPGLGASLRTNSASSVQSGSHPIQYTVTANTPLRSKSKNVSLILEIENPAHGTVTISPSPSQIDKQKPVAHEIDVRQLKLGEAVSFLRKADDDAVVLNLRRSRDLAMQVVLQWA